MASPQTGTFPLGTNSHAYLEFDLAAAAHMLEAVARIAALRELGRRSAARDRVRMLDRVIPSGTR
jgi:hypothetical protein